MIINSSKKEKNNIFCLATSVAAMFLVCNDFRSGALRTLQFGEQRDFIRPFAMTHAGEAGKAPGWTIGDYTNVMNIVLVFGQILILRSRFEKMQLFQLIIGFLFGFLLDVNMRITASVVCDSLLFKAVAQTAGCLVLGIGIAFEVRCGSVTMPGEGFPAAISRACGAKFAKAKICVDVSLVAVAVVLGYVYFGEWQWNVVGPGTLFAMFFVGMIVRFLDGRMGWFDGLLHYRPGFRRYLFGLARYVHSMANK